jgi:acetyltransferase-like isoleucine patch superfamily enzyme
MRGQVSLRLYRAIYKEFSYGPGAQCVGKPLVVMGKGSSITIGERILMVSDVRRANIALFSACKLRTMEGARLVIGDRVALNGTSITCGGQIDIGDNTMIAANTLIMDSDFHQLWPPEARWNESHHAERRPVTIGRNVWIGAGSIILKGARIGENSIIGAGSVVSGVIPKNVIAGGVPARVIREISERDQMGIG